MADHFPLRPPAFYAIPWCMKAEVAREGLLRGKEWHLIRDLGWRWSCEILSRAHFAASGRGSMGSQGETNGRKALAAQRSFPGI